MDALYIVLIFLLYAGCEMVIRLCESVEPAGEPVGSEAE